MRQPPTQKEESLEALPVVCKFHIHRFRVICLFKLWIKFKGYIFFMNLKINKSLTFYTMYLIPWDNLLFIFSNSS